MSVLLFVFIILAVVLYIVGCIVLIRRSRREPATPDVGWDDLGKCLTEFPADQFEQLPVMTADEGRELIALKAMTSGSMVFGEARWFADGTGMIFVKKQPLLSEETEI